MGNTCNGDTTAETLGYYSPDDNSELVEHVMNPQSIMNHDPKELDSITRVDVHAFFPHDICYLISAAWMATWLEFVKGQCPPPGPVNNRFLISLSATRQPLPKLDFKLVSAGVWEFIYKLYGGGPVMFVRVPVGFDDRLYRNSKWTRQVDFRKLIRVVRCFVS